MCSLFLQRKTAAMQNTLFYVWFISIAKDRHYPKYITLCVVYFYSERPPLSKIYQSMCGLFLQQKTTAIQNILLYIWFISIAKDRRYPKYIILCVVYFYHKKLPQSKIRHSLYDLLLYKRCCLKPGNFFLYQIASQHQLVHLVI